MAASGAAHALDTGSDRFDAFFQLTVIGQHKPAFRAPYTNLGGTPNSLRPEAEDSWTVSTTAYLSWRLWDGGQLHLVPEVISLVPLSELKGLGGGIPNGELQKTGEPKPTLYRSRLFLRQTWNLGGEAAELEAGPLQRAGTVTARRVVLTVGNLSVLDVFDRNAYAGDVRQQFVNMAFMTHAAFDFAADARGYSWGLAAEWHHDAWSLRAGRFLVPRDPNQLSLDPRILRWYGDQVELERRHQIDGEPGALKLLLYRNRANAGRFDEALDALRADPSRNATACTGFSYGSGNATAPDLCWARRANSKLGVGLNLEQRAGWIGVFGRAMVSDGRTEVYSYTSADRSLSMGAILDGERWGRPDDAAGLGWAGHAISAAHAAYLAAGGIDGFVGDGALSRATERVIEAWYRVSIVRGAWLTLDAQRIVNPGFNADRGPVTVWGARLHLEL
jgi:hypothetical protein